MKYRLGFVTNSSSSSFIISKYNLSGKQIDQIKNYFEIAEKIQTEEDEYGFGFFGWLERNWVIEENEEYICGNADMDNFSMYKFLKHIGIPDDEVYWADWCYGIDIMKAKYEVEYGKR